MRISDWSSDVCSSDLSDGFDEVAVRDQIAVLVDGNRQLRQRTCGRTEDRPGEVQRIELRLVERAQNAVGLLLVERGRAAQVRADLRVNRKSVVKGKHWSGRVDHGVRRLIKKKP